jgi:hypothetical protein
MRKGGTFCGSHGVTRWMFGQKTNGFRVNLITSETHIVCYKTVSISVSTTMAWLSQGTSNKSLIDAMISHEVIKAGSDIDKSFRLTDRGTFIRQS